MAPRVGGASSGVKVNWHESWLAVIDPNGDKYGEYIIRVDSTTSRCSWCSSTFQYTRNGVSALRQHAKGGTHKVKSDHIKQRVVGQRVLVSSSAADNGQREQGPRINRNNRNIVIPSLSAPVTLPNTPFSLDDKVLKAEVVMMLKGVESQYSYSSYSNMVSVLKKVDPDSPIIAKMSMKRDKVAYVVSHGLGPYFHKQTVVDAKQAVGFTLGMDGSSFKQGRGGLTTHMDIHIRFWSEQHNKVKDTFFDLHTLGHEPASLQVESVKKTLQDNDLSLANMVCLSRDNPNVMKTVARLLTEAAEAAGSPKLIDAPCFLHPVHTSHQKLCTSLELDVAGLLVNIHGFFKLSAARREDVMDIRNELRDELGQEFEEPIGMFFLRHVDTRWLEIGPVIDRLIRLWTSTKKYFLEFLPQSRLSNNKDAVRTARWEKKFNFVIILSHLRYKSIVEVLDPDVEQANLARLKFVSVMSTLCKPFLLKLQAERPLIHELYEKCGNLFASLAATILTPESVPKHGSHVVRLDLDDPTILLDCRSCTYKGNLEDELTGLPPRQRKLLEKELQQAVLVQLRYLKNRLPFDNLFLRYCSFMDPKKRRNPALGPMASRAAKELNRFSEEEMLSLRAQNLQYQNLPDNQVPAWDHINGRLDQWWGEIFTVLEQENGEPPQEMKKLVKLCCTVSHGQGWVERGFSQTKRIVENRNLLSDDSLKGQKRTLGAIQFAGGAENVPITVSLLNEVKFASSKKKEDEKKEREKKKKAEEDAVVQAEAMRRLQEKDLEKGKWREKKEKIQTEIKTNETLVNTQNDQLNAAMSRGLRLSDPVTKNAMMKTVQNCQKIITETTAQNVELQNKLLRHMGKKPRD